MIKLPGCFKNCLQSTLFLLLAALPAASNSQTPVFVETFSSPTPGFCDQGTPALGFLTIAGPWNVTSLGLNDADANVWYVSATEQGRQPGECAEQGCHVDLTKRNRTLHIGNVSSSPNAASLCPTGDCGAIYDPGNAMNLVQTDKRVESPAFLMQGGTQYFMLFNYLHYGDYPDSSDRATVEFFDGNVWVPSLDVVPRTINFCGTGYEWQQHFVLLPLLPSSASCRIGFRWRNDNGGIGTNPSFAVDSIVVAPITPPEAIITVSDTNVCVNDSIDFSTAFAGPNTGYTWIFPGASIAGSTQQNPTDVFYTAPGTYTATLIVSNMSGSDTASVNITVNPCSPPTANFFASDTVFCERDCITFSDYSINGATAWSWSFPGGLPSTSTSPSPPPICYDTPGFYDVTLIVYNQFGSDTLTKTAYLEVELCPLPIADFSSTVTQNCPQHCVTFTDNSSFGPIIAYQWFFPGAIIDTSTSPNPSVCYAQEGFYDVQLIVYNQYGSDTIIKYSEVRVEFVPTAFASPDTAMYFGESYHMLAGGGITYQWTPTAGLSDSSGAPDPAQIPNPIATPLVTTTYTVAITDGSGCTAYRQVTITILHDNDVFVPTAFSPNGDGINDVLYVRGNNIFGVRFTIFDRWGEKLFESTSASVGWDGTYKEKELNPGVYTYIVTVNYSDGKSVTNSGTVTLVR